MPFDVRMFFLIQFDVFLQAQTSRMSRVCEIVLIAYQASVSGSFEIRFTNDMFSKILEEHYWISYKKFEINSNCIPPKIFLWNFQHVDSNVFEIFLPV